MGFLSGIEQAAENKVTQKISGSSMGMGGGMGNKMGMQGQQKSSNQNAVAATQVTVEYADRTLVMQNPMVTEKTDANGVITLTAVGTAIAKPKPD